MNGPTSVDEVLALLERGDYVADRGLATTLFLALRLGRPLFLEGEAGVGKTEIAKVLAAQLDRRLIRLQCYEGLDQSSAVYDWNYSHQMMEIRLAEAVGESDRDELERTIYSERFLLKRPLLQALESDDSGPPVLLIDELDRADEAFEAFLLELLSDFQVTIPELGTIRAKTPPIVILTSNRTREVHDAIKRRCFYAWVDYPSSLREMAILERRIPSARRELVEQVVAFVQALRTRDVYKRPGVAESIDWTNALIALDRQSLSPEVVDSTLGVLLKYEDDLGAIAGDEAASILRTIERERAG